MSYDQKIASARKIIDEHNNNADSQIKFEDFHKKLKEIGAFIWGGKEDPGLDGKYKYMDKQTQEDQLARTEKVNEFDIPKVRKLYWDAFTLEWDNGLRGRKKELNEEEVVELEADVGAAEEADPIAALEALAAEHGDEEEKEE